MATNRVSNLSNLSPHRTDSSPGHVAGLEWPRSLMALNGMAGVELGDTNDGVRRSPGFLRGMSPICMEARTPGIGCSELPLRRSGLAAMVTQQPRQSPSLGSTLRCSACRPPTYVQRYRSASQEHGTGTPTREIRH